MIFKFSFACIRVFRNPNADVWECIMAWEEVQESYGEPLNKDWTKEIW